MGPPDGGPEFIIAKKCQGKAEFELSKTDVDAVDIAQRQRHLFLLNKIKSNQALTKTELDELGEYERKQKAKGRGTKGKAAAAAEQIIWSQKEAAEYVDRDVRTIRRWLKDGMSQVQADGRIGYHKAVLEFFKASEGKSPLPARQRDLEAQADLRETKAKLAKLELAIKEGELIRKDEIEQQRVQRILIVKRALRGFGRKLAPRLAKIKSPRKIQALIDSDIVTIIQIFAGK